MSFLKEFSDKQIDDIRWKLFTLDDIDGDKASFSLNGIPLSKRSFRLMFGAPSIQAGMVRTKAERAAEFSEVDFEAWMRGPRGHQSFVEAAGGDPTTHRFPRTRRRRH